MTTTPPPPEGTRLLKKIVADLFDQIVDLRGEIVRGFETPAPISAIAFPFVFDNENDGYNSKIEKLRLSELGFDGANLLVRLKTVLDVDHHLRKCCVTEYGLARCLDLFFARTFETFGNVHLEKLEFDDLFHRFNDFLRSDPFVARTYSHLFNFHSKLEEIAFGPLRIMEMSNLEIAELLGERTPYSFLHPFGGGNFFLVSETRDVVEDDSRWVISELSRAQDFTRLLQYYKDGVIHVNYTSYYFLPRWVNVIRKPGIMLVGPQRRIPYDSGKRPFTFDSEDVEPLSRRFAYFERPEIDALFGENRNELGNVIDMAGYYYEASHTEVENGRRLIDLAISLEALFNPETAGELTFQLSQLAAQFIGESQRGKSEIYLSVREMYKKRSKLLHGDPKSQEVTFLSLDELDGWTSLIRRAIEKFTLLYLQGETKHSAVLNKIRASIFDPNVRRQLRRTTNLARFEAAAF